MGLPIRIDARCKFPEIRERKRYFANSVIQINMLPNNKVLVPKHSSGNCGSIMVLIICFRIDSWQVYWTK